MARTADSVVLIGIVLVATGMGAILAALSISTHTSFGRMMGSGMMGGATSDTGAGGIEWAVLLVSTVLLLGSLVLLLRTRRPPSPVPADAPMSEARKGPHTDMDIRLVVDKPRPIPGMTLVKLLGEDERRMYLEIRERGGAVLQRDLVALGTFSKAKVTRVLDRLERKGIVVRERHGMTNRVRLVARAAE